MSKYTLAQPMCAPTRRCIASSRLDSSPRRRCAAAAADFITGGTRNLATRDSSVIHLEEPNAKTTLFLARVRECMPKEEPEELSARDRTWRLKVRLFPENVSPKQQSFARLQLPRFVYGEYERGRDRDERGQ